MWIIIMMNENNVSINMYAQLPIVAEIRTKTVGPGLSAGAVPHEKTSEPYNKTCVFFNGSQNLLMNPDMSSKITCIVRAHSSRKTNYKLY